MKDDSQKLKGPLIKPKPMRKESAISITVSVAEDKDNNAQEITVDQSFGGQTVAQQKYFVSNGFVEKIFDNMQTSTELIKSKMETKMEELTEIVNSLLDIREKDLPFYENRIDIVEKRTHDVIKLVSKKM